MEKQVFIKRDSFNAVLANPDDQVLVRQLLMKHVNNKDKQTIIQEFNETMKSRFELRQNREKNSLIKTRRLG